MGFNDRMEPDDGDFEDFLRQIVDMGHLEGAALGITKQVIDKGEESLSDKQKYVFRKEVMDEFVTQSCERCDGDIPWSEMYAAYDNGGKCGWCAHMENKDD